MCYTVFSVYLTLIFAASVIKSQNNWYGGGFMEESTVLS